MRIKKGRLCSETQPGLTPIRITRRGDAVPASACISKLINGGALFDSDINCKLIFNATKGCPFSKAQGTELQLVAGLKRKRLKLFIKTGSYGFRIDVPKAKKKPASDPFDVTISP